MNKPLTELNTGRCYIEDDEPPAKDPCYEKETTQAYSSMIPIGSGPSGDASLSRIISHTYQQVISPETLDPYSFRY